MSLCSVVRTSLDDLAAIRLVDAAHGASVSIVPAFGGNVQALVLAKAGRPHSVIHGHGSHAEFTDNVDFRSTLLLPFPNRVADGRYTFQGRIFQLPVNEPARGHALHGFHHQRPMRVAASKVGATFAELILEDDYTGGVEGYPFPFRTRVTHRLESPGRYGMTTEVRNTGTTPMPFGTGWHPYFRIGATVDDLTLRLPSVRAVELNQRMLPVEPQPSAGFSPRSVALRGHRLDALFALEPRHGIVAAELRSDKEDITLRLWLERGPGRYNFLCAYVPPHRHSIAIEPMTCATNAFNNGFGLIVLHPGDTFAARCGVELS